MCNRAIERLRKDSQKEKKKFYVTSSYILKKSFLRFVKGYPRQEYIPLWPSAHSIPNPKPNIYYAFNEDTNPFTRFQNTCKCSKNEYQAHFEPPTEPFVLRDPYSEEAASKKYLETKPVSFVIFGKPGVNSRELAMMIADGWKCVLISPESLVEQEIQSKTEKGKYIEQILRSGRNLSSEIIQNLIKNRINMRDVRHKGYVIEGLPFIPNHPNFDHLFYPKIAELRTKSIINEINTENDLLSTCEMILTPSSSDYEDIQKSSCKRGIDPEQDIPNQIDEIFSTWPLKPSIIIYIICPDEDLSKKFELLKADSLILKSVDSTLSVDTVANMQLFTEDNSDDNPQMTFSNASDTLKENREYISKEIEEIRNSVKNRCELYKRLAMLVIDKWVLLQNPQNVIRVDGRTTPLQMFEIVSVRLRILSLPRLLLPKRLIERIDELGMVDEEGEEEEKEEEEKEDTRQITLEEELEGMSKENAFREMASKESVGLRFPWRLSRWKFYCPVELAKGRTVEGSSKYSLTFLKNIFFLSSEEALQLFLDNPRTFLLPPNPRLTCKIAIIGPKYSGKSKLSRELARILNGTVVDVNDLENSFKRDCINNKIIDAMHEMVDDVIRELRIKLEKERKMRKFKKEADLKAWYEDIVLTIQRVIDIVRSENTITPDEQYKDISDELKSLRKKLKENNIAHVETDHRLWQEIKKDINILHAYAPDYLKKDEPPIRKLTEHDPEVSNILQNRVKYLYDEPIELSTDEKADLIIKHIQNIPYEILEDEINRDGGFIIDDMYMELDVWKKILKESNIIFEDVIIIFENEPYYRLIQNWRYFQGKYDEESEENQFRDKEDDMFEDESNIELEQYFQHLDDYQSALRNFRYDMDELNQNVILCEIGSIKNITSHVVKRIKDRYDWKATVMSEEEKENERLIEEEEMRQDETYPEGEEKLMDKEEKARSIKSQIIPKDNRRLGDSNNYCPVVLTKYNVLWKGKEDYSAIFMDKIYLLSSERALKEFIENPLNFSIPLIKPPIVIPPLRISVIGLPGSGKTTLSNALSKEYGLFRVDYIECLEKYMTSRRMKAFTLKDALIIPEEKELEEIDLAEDINDIRYSTNETLIFMFIKEYIQNGGTLPKYMIRECFLNYFQPPFDKCGLVLDGFPSCSQDVELMLEKCMVPEIVIELKCSLEKSLERLLPKYLNFWKRQQEKDKFAEKERYNEEMNNYIKRRDEWIEKIIKEKHEYFSNEEAEMVEDESYNFSMNNNNFELSSNERIELEETWREENSEPVLFTDWEDLVTARERILRRLEEIYESNSQKIESVRTSMENETIPWIEIDGEQNERKMIIQVQRHLESYVFRDISMFERTYSVDMETAERLLERGYYFLSSFGRWCPVQLYQNKIPIQMFLPMEANNEIIPVIHRQYIYFLCGQDAASAFAKNPLKYLEQDSAIPLIPMNLSIIGPPKCGKTTLAERFAETYGLRLISLDKALQYVTSNYSWTELATKIESHFQDNVAIDNKIMSRAVEMYSINPRTASQGYVLDGFPCNRGESEELAFLNIRPMIVIDLKADLKFCLECLSYTNKEANEPVDFGVERLVHLYNQWEVDQENYRDWLKKFSQNIFEIDASNSKWGVWTRADQVVRKKLTNIRRYFREADYDKVHNLENMCVSPYEFKSYQSIYESYCPVCLLLDNIIVSSGGLIDRIGVVQFREYFYWICKKHRKDFIKDPLRYIPPLNRVILPKIRPRIVDETIDLKHACWARRLQANGCCLVTYVDSLPNRNLISGKIDLAVLYDDKLYLFCSQHCQDQFLIRWMKYCDIKIHFPFNIPHINITNLPIIGYLEETVAKCVIKAVNEVAVLRPKIPGLSVAASSAIYMGVLLKIRNVSCTFKEMDIYRKVSERMKARRRIVDMAICNMKHKLNPNLRIPASYSKMRISDISDIPRISSIRFRRTSPTQTLDDPEDSS